MVNNAQFIFYLCCYSVTIALFIIGIFKYVKNDDLCEISFKPFNEEIYSSYPSFTFCISNPFNESQLKKYGMNKSTYSSILLGGEFNDTVLKVDFDEVSFNLRKLIVGTQVTLNQQDQDEIQHLELFDTSDTVIATDKRIFKCLTFNMPSQTGDQLHYASVAIQDSMFQSISEDLFILFHYPKQMFRPVVANKWSWPERSKSSNLYSRVFTLKSMEVLHRRNKANEPCKYYSNYDDSFKSAMIERAKCRPPYWISKKNLSMCNDQHKMRLIASDIYTEGIRGTKKSKYIAKPCVDMQKLLFSFDQNDITLDYLKAVSPRLDTSTNDSIMLFIIDFIEPNFKEIKQVKAFGIESLIGNVGGYIGLFLGFSIIQLPIFFAQVKRQFRSRIRCSVVSDKSMVDIETNNDLSENEILQRRMFTLEEKVDLIIKSKL